MANGAAAVPLQSLGGSNIGSSVPVEFFGPLADLIQEMVQEHLSESQSTSQAATATPPAASTPGDESSVPPSPYGSSAAAAASAATAASTHAPPLPSGVGLAAVTTPAGAQADNDNMNEVASVVPSNFAAARARSEPTPYAHAGLLGGSDAGAVQSKPSDTSAAAGGGNKLRLLSARGFAAAVSPSMPVVLPPAHVQSPHLLPEAAAPSRRCASLEPLLQGPGSSPFPGGPGTSGAGGPILLAPPGLQHQRSVSVPFEGGPAALPAPLGLAHRSVSAPLDHDHDAALASAGLPHSHGAVQ